MRRWALVQGGAVVSVVEQDYQPQVAGHWVECTSAGPGWCFDGASFTAPTTSAPRSITSYAFKMRMTQAERIAARTKAETDPVIYDFMDLLNSKQDGVNLDSTPMVAGLAALVAAGVLTADRPAQIRADPILDSERA